MKSCPKRIARNLASSACLAIMSLLDSHLKTDGICHKIEVARLHHITALSNVSSVDVMYHALSQQKVMHMCATLDLVKAVLRDVRYGTQHEL